MAIRKIVIKYDDRTSEITKLKYDDKDRTNKKESWDPNKVGGAQCKLGPLEIYGNKTCVRVGGNLYCW